MHKLEIELQPKQIEVYNEIATGTAQVIGMGGGRGSAKSSCIDRLIIALMLEKKCLICCVMRNFDQVKKYHVDVIRREFPQLADNVKTSPPANLIIGRSQCDFSYAETRDDVERRFQSGNYDYIFVDQAEQFTGQEIREMRKACRSAGKFKIILSFNMRGTGIQDLKNWFHLGKLNKDEDPKTYKFFKFNPWDNVIWVQEALKKDGYSVKDYYRWSDDQRKQYASKVGYTQTLATDDEVIRKADWEGSWDSIEGAYYASAWDRDATCIDTTKNLLLNKPWSRHWLSQDWGRGHFCVTYWHYKVSLSEYEVNQILGWKLVKPINVIVTYRELILNDMESPEIAQAIVNATPLNEREKIKSFYLGKDAFNVRDSKNTTAIQIGKLLSENNLPFPIKADDDRIGGAQLIGKLLKSTKGHGFINIDGKSSQLDDVWFITTACPTLIESIPKLMRDKDNIDDVDKTDKSKPVIEQDCYDAVRYGLKSMLNPRKRNAEEDYQEKMQVASPQERLMLTLKRHQINEKKSRNQLNENSPAWMSNLRDVSK